MTCVERIGACLVPLHRAVGAHIPAATRRSGVGAVGVGCRARGNASLRTRSSKRPSSKTSSARMFACPPPAAWPSADGWRADARRRPPGWVRWCAGRGARGAIGSPTSTFSAKNRRRRCCLTCCSFCRARTSRYRTDRACTRSPRLFCGSSTKVVQPPSGAASEPYVRHGVAKRARARVSDACPAAAMKGRRARAH